MFWFVKKKNIKYVIIAAVLFFATWAVCYFGVLPGLAGEMEQGDMSELYKGENFFKLLLTNWLHCLVCIIGCGILSVPMLIFDAGTIGLTGVAMRLFGGTHTQYFSMLVPHCIFEIPALIIACAGGMKMFKILRLYTKGEKDGLKEQLTEIAKSFILITVLLIIAAAVEAFLTPVIASRFGG